MRLTELIIHKEKGCLVSNVQYLAAVVCEKRKLVAVAVDEVGLKAAALQGVNL